MKNLKLELFNFKKNLTLDQEEVSGIVEGHMNACNNLSEKSIVLSLNERLKHTHMIRVLKLYWKTLMMT